MAIPYHWRRELRNSGDTVVFLLVSRSGSISEFGFELDARVQAGCHLEKGGIDWSLYD